MTNLAIYALGFLGQGLFGARLIVQLWHSEKAKNIASPLVFWQLSLAGSFIFLLYGLFRSDPVIIIGQSISYYIYIRNLQLKNAWQTIPLALRSFLYILPFLASTLFFISGDHTDSLNKLRSQALHPIMILGAIGQLALNLRFVYQWYYAEKAKDAVLPIGFWHISTWASVLVIIYAGFHPINGYDPVLLVSQGIGIFVYIRNIFLFHRNSRAILHHKTSK